MQEPGMGSGVGLSIRVQGQRFRGGLVVKAHRLCVSLNSRLESNKEEEVQGRQEGCAGACSRFGGAQPTPDT